ncbi:hypothetical protein [Clostridium massiliodielmoense]|uniref:hypothetical protein n=1 Tax=Clostridium massiliodielmoense TaxID=1776385 RepID=UPI000166867C|nr:hypothetical protein [Clostridium massiliodielmoense]EDS77805.1 conserved hypothetical protein [Clostridium botulinum C str. Eklund]KEH97113.1 hypothetical protein Z962_04775 [Clostridium botulinum C/D str. BKT12695]NEZ49567.1 hypothetical protein [Clostridium botulinum]
MTENKNFSNTIILFLKCYIVIFILGFLLPEAIGFLLRTFRNNCSTYNNSTFVFNLVNENESILWYYKYIVNMYFSL